MKESLHAWGILQALTWQHVLLVLGVLIAARLSVLFVRWVLGHAAEKAPPRLRMNILRLVPITHLLIDLAALVVIVPILVEPTFQNVAVLAAGVGLAVAFGLKDYASSLAAGVVTILENTYQPGDWIKVDGTYGEVKSIGLRAVHLITPDDTQVIVPHSRLWSTSIFNASGGSRSLLCVADFFLHPDHDAVTVRQRLAEIAESSAFRKSETPVTVIVLEKPWGTNYRLKAYVKESRTQFDFLTELTVRGKEALRGMDIRFAQAPYAETQ